MTGVTPSADGDGRVPGVLSENRVGRIREIAENHSDIEVSWRPNSAVVKDRTTSIRRGDRRVPHPRLLQRGI